MRVSELLWKPQHFHVREQLSQRQCNVELHALAFCVFVCLGKSDAQRRCNPFGVSLGFALTKRVRKCELAEVAQ